jgi:hypothetical protein
MSAPVMGDGLCLLKDCAVTENLKPLLIELTTCFQASEMEDVEQYVKKSLFNSGGLP